MTADTMIEEKTRWLINQASVDPDGAVYVEIMPNAHFPCLFSQRRTEEHAASILAQVKREMLSIKQAVTENDGEILADNPDSISCMANIPVSVIGDLAAHEDVFGVFVRAASTPRARITGAPAI